MLAPIRRLPVEILAEIFDFYSSCHKDLPLRLSWVCRSWRGVALAMPHIWSKVCLSTRTKVEKVAFILDKTAVRPLYVEIDTDIDAFTSKTVSPHESPRYAGLVLAATQAKRWRSISIISSPPRYDMETDEYLKTLPVVFDGPLEGLRSFKITPTWHDPSTFIFLYTTFPHDKITDIELSSPNALYHFAQPQFATIFRALIKFKAEVRLMGVVVDILAQFQQLETLDVEGLHLPTYPAETDLQLVRTLKYLKINTVSVQWMAGRTFPNLEECVIIRPFHPKTIVRGCSVNLPICTKFTYDNETIDTLANFCIPILDILTIRSHVWNKDHGSDQLTAVWSGTPGDVAPLKPRILHLDTQCHDLCLIEVLSMLPELEGLHLGVNELDGLGQMFFTSLQAEEETGWNTQAVTHVCRLCPSLKSLSILYHYIPDDEPDDMSRLFHQVVESRQKTAMPLQSVEVGYIRKRRPDPGPWASPLRSDPWLSLCD
jgi:hypothetical protein